MAIHVIRVRQASSFYGKVKAQIPDYLINEVLDCIIEPMFGIAVGYYVECLIALLLLVTAVLLITAIYKGEVYSNAVDNTRGGVLLGSLSPAAGKSIIHRIPATQISTETKPPVVLVLLVKTAVDTNNNSLGSERQADVPHPPAPTRWGEGEKVDENAHPKLEETMLNLKEGREKEHKRSPHHRLKKLVAKKLTKTLLKVVRKGSYTLQKESLTKT